MEDLLEAVNRFCDERGDATLAALLGYRVSSVFTNWRARGAIPLRERMRVREILDAKRVSMVVEKGKTPVIKTA